MKHTSILFVCHGNICRSPMAQFVMQKYVDDAGLTRELTIGSKATSSEELGNPPYPPARAKLREEGIPMTAHIASRISADDYGRYDLIIGMDGQNMRNMERIFGGDREHKLHKLLEFAGSADDIADPWYSGDFDTTFRQISAGCAALLSFLQGQVS